ncbi:hypothetical protein GO755_20500 [Spirosoma sp. HMF4905]|uniref:Uncharacterized protein n=1 Tax=Spirosoma arboris TaxID=2682092 RepID=A0A7K1SF42_9BACT|nr:hypothetical protein [Spirosoma arboris]MVM32437.1 hypothetical protein [Spirosoma arboris]
MSQSSVKGLRLRGAANPASSEQTGCYFGGRGKRNAGENSSWWRERAG